MRKLFPGVFTDGKKLYTKSKLEPVYGERKMGKFREWIPTRSKLAAAIKKGLKHFPFSKSSKILYLGAASGTTVSHLSDISKDGIIYAVEFSERVARKLVELAEKTNNVIPIISDARKPDDYYYIHRVDAVFVDVSQPDEIEISIRNAKMFLGNGKLVISIKSRSIDAIAKPTSVYKQAMKKLREAGFSVDEIVKLEPYEKDHAVIVASFNK